MPENNWTDAPDINPANLWRDLPTPEDYMHYVAKDLSAAWDAFDQAGVPRPDAASLARPIIDRYRQQAGLAPLKNAAQIYQESMQRLSEGRSWWQNLAVAAPETYGELAGGITETGYKLGVTQAIAPGINMALRAMNLATIPTTEQGWVDQLDQWKQGFSVREDWSGQLGQLVGNTLFALTVSGLGGATGETAGLKGKLLEGLKIGGIFGVSQAGLTFADVARQRQQGNYINPAAEWTAAIGNGMAETAGEMFGWTIAKGVATQLFKHAPGLSRIFSTKGMQAGFEAMKKFAKTGIVQAAKGAPAGFAEEALTQIAQDSINKALGIAPDMPWSALPGNALQAGIMGAIQPILLGGPLAGINSIQTGRLRARLSDQIGKMNDIQLVQYNEMLQLASPNNPLTGWAKTQVQQALAERGVTANSDLYENYKLPQAKELPNIPFPAAEQPAEQPNLIFPTERAQIIPGQPGAETFKFPTQENAPVQENIPFQQPQFVPPEAMKFQSEAPIYQFPRPQAEHPGPAVVTENVLPKKPTVPPPPPHGETAEQKIERLQQEVAAARKEARTDELTGLGNKRQYGEALRDFASQTEQTGKPFSVILLDAANLKAANTVLGHEGANQLLRAIADSLRGATAERPGDVIVTRQGGDEFAIVLPNTDSKGASLVRDRVEQAIGRQQIVPGLSMFVSGGMATYTKGSDLSTLLQQADQEVEQRKADLKLKYGEPTTRAEAEALITRIQAEQSPTEVGTGPEPPMATSLQRTWRLSPTAEKAAAAVGQIATDSPGQEITSAAPTYETASKNQNRTGKNIYVRQTTDKSNADRVLLVQWSSDLLQTGERGGPADQYYDKLYAEREGYVRADDFWELPQWIGQAALNLPKSDVYVIRDLDEALKFFNQAGYKEIAFSVLDVNKDLVRKVIDGYKGKITVGGYVNWDEVLGAGRVGPLPVGFTTNASEIDDNIAKELADYDDVENPQIWHVTTAADAVLKEGLKSTAETGKTGLGGAPSNTVSVTWNEVKAHTIAERLKLAIQAARGEVTPHEILNYMIAEYGDDEIAAEHFGKVAGLTIFELDEFTNNGTNPDLDARVDELWEGEAYRLLQKLDNSLATWDVSTFYMEANGWVGLVGTAEELAKNDPEQVQILKLGVRKGAWYAIIPDEFELRFHPEDVHVLSETGRPTHVSQYPTLQAWTENLNGTATWDKTTAENLGVPWPKGSSENESIAFDDVKVNPTSNERVKEIELTRGGKYVTLFNVNDADAPRVAGALQAAAYNGYRPGTDYRHFAGTKIQPRLTLSEGCLHGCAFCAVKPRKELALVSPTAIQAQVLSFQNLDFDLVYVNDKTFGQAENAGELENVYKQLKEQNPNFQGFIVQTSAAQMAKMTPELLQKLGIRYVEIGVESFNPEILKDMKKPATPELIERAAEKLDDAGIAMIPNVMVGLPGETADTYQNTLNFLEKWQTIISHLNIYNLAVYQGTDLADKLEVKNPQDVDENSVARSWQDDPQLHQTFNDTIHALGVQLLDNPAIGIAAPLFDQARRTDVQVVTIRDSEIEVANPITEEQTDLPPNPIVQGIKNLIADEGGAFNPDAVGRLVTGGLETAVTAGKGVHALTYGVLFDESHSLERASAAGSYAVDVVQQASNLARMLAAKYHTAWTHALTAIPLTQRGGVLRWMQTRLPDGQTNWSTLIEHPDRLTAVPEQVVGVLRAMRQFQDESGDLAVALRVPQVQRVKDEKGNVSWGLGPFVKAKDGRYFRLFNRQGRDLFEFMSGDTFESLLDWLMAHPERNPSLPTEDREELRQALQQRKELLADVRVEGGIKKAGSLAFVRSFDELPVFLMVNGKQVDIMEADPLSHFTRTVEQQIRELALWQVAQEELLPRYGVYDEETGRYTYPLGSPGLNMTDVPGLFARLRKEVADRANKDPGVATGFFNRLIDNYGRISGKGWMQEYFQDFNESVLGKAVSTVDTMISTSVLQLAPLWDITQWTLALPGVGFKSGMQGVAEAMMDIMRHPKSFAAEYEALGVMLESYTDWTIHRESWATDILRKNFRNIGMAPGRLSEHLSQFVIARVHDVWLRNLGGKEMSLKDSAYLRETLHLNDNQIGEIARGEMSVRTRAAALQNAVNAIAGLPEFAIRKGWLQNNRIGRFLFRFISVANAGVRLGHSLAVNLTHQIQTATNTSLPMDTRKEAAGAVLKAGFSLLLFVAAIAGKGFVQKYLRRAAQGRPLIDPEDPQAWYGVVATATAEGGVFGPLYRIFEAGKYTNGSVPRMAAQLVFPLGVLTDFAEALIGMGHYTATPWAERLKGLGMRYAPLYRFIDQWHSNLMYPHRNDYNQIRKHVRAWQKSQGEQPYLGGEIPKNYNYYHVFEAIRDGNDDEIRDAIVAYKAWAKAEGITADDARTRLRSSLLSRQPVNLAVQRKKDFFKSLSPDIKELAEAEDQRYNVVVDRLTRKPGIPTRPARPQQPAKPAQGGDWYAAQ